MTRETKGFLQLIQRSPDRGEGWRSISDTLLQLCEDVAAAEPELLEFDKAAKRIRLTERGEGALYAIS